MQAQHERPLAGVEIREMNSIRPNHIWRHRSLPLSLPSLNDLKEGIHQINALAWKSRPDPN